jgi:hypothetical protein
VALAGSYLTGTQLAAGDHDSNVTMRLGRQIAWELLAMRPLPENQNRARQMPMRLKGTAAIQGSAQAMNRNTLIAATT